VTIDTASLQRQVSDLARMNVGTDVWIGLHDLQYEGFFQWSSGKTMILIYKSRKVNN